MREGTVPNSPPALVPTRPGGQGARPTVKVQGAREGPAVESRRQRRRRPLHQPLHPWRTARAPPKTGEAPPFAEGVSITQSLPSQSLPSSRREGRRGGLSLTQPPHQRLPGSEDPRRAMAGNGRSGAPAVASSRRSAATTSAGHRPPSSKCPAGVLGGSPPEVGWWHKSRSTYRIS